MNRRINENCILNNTDSVPFVTFEALNQFDFIKHAFSTRIGGVSEGYLESLNLGFERGDEINNVITNFQRISTSVGFDMTSIVATNQQHTTVVRVVEDSNCGEGINRERVATAVDGQVTNASGVTLLVYGADCTPVYLLDPDRRAIGLCHSGWKGTLNNISLEAVRLMQENFGSEPSDLIAVIGPSICGDCYEIGYDVAGPFIERFGEPFVYDSGILKKGQKPDKHQLNLWLANKYNLLEAGLSEANIQISGLCTKCNKDLFYSHRRDGSQRGVMAAFLTLV